MENLPKTTLKTLEIATAVCALPRNDRFFDTLKRDTAWVSRLTVY